MRNITLFGLVGTMIVGCGGADETQPAPKSPETTAVQAPTQTPVETKKEEPVAAKKTFTEIRDMNLKTATDAFNAHDAKKAVSIFTDDVSFTLVGMPEMHGKAEAEKAHEQWFNMAGDMKFALAHSWCNEKEMTCAIQWQWTGTDSKGLMPGMKPTNKPVGADMLSFAWMNADGMVKKVVSYTNMMAPMIQAGVAMPGVPANMMASMKKMAQPVPTLASAPEHFMSSGSETETKNMETVKAMNAAFEAHKSADVFATATDDVEHWSNDADKPTKGKVEGKKMVDAMFTAFPDTKSPMSTMFAAGDFVVAEETFTGTMKKPFMGMPATNKSMTMHMGWAYMLKGGKIAKMWAFSNPMEGMPAPAAKADAKAATPAKADATKTDAKAATPAKADATKAATPAKK